MKSIIFFLLFAAFPGVLLNVTTPNHNHQTKRKMKKWFEDGQWLHGLKMTPHESINEEEFERQYHQHQKYWDEAFAFLRDHDLLSLPKGKYPVDGENVFVSVTEDPSKNYENTAWESHRKYIDIQSVISGEEEIAVCSLSKATVTQPYNVEKDVAHYSAEGTRYRALPGTFFIFFSTDVHRPNITPGGNKIVKKIVIKVRAAE
jgi:YhcH/YjgK/YiaL family protein